MGVCIKGMSRSACPGMHVLHGLRYVTPTRFADMILEPSVVKKPAPKVKLLLVTNKSSDNENKSDDSKKSSDDNNESTFS